MAITDEVKIGDELSCGSSFHIDFGKGSGESSDREAVGIFISVVIVKNEGGRFGACTGWSKPDIEVPVVANSEIAGAQAEDLEATCSRSEQTRVANSEYVVSCWGVMDKKVVRHRGTNRDGAKIGSRASGGSSVSIGNSNIRATIWIEVDGGFSGASFSCHGEGVDVFCIRIIAVDANGRCS